MRGWRYCRFDGSTDRAERNYLIRRFNEPDSPFFLFIISTRSGGMGLNLQSADTCILFDSDWNPQSDIQAMARVHRIGQTKTVHVYRLVSSGTVEERVGISQHGFDDVVRIKAHTYLASWLSSRCWNALRRNSCWKW